MERYLLSSLALLSGVALLFQNCSSKWAAQPSQTEQSSLLGLAPTITVTLTSPESSPTNSAYVPVNLTLSQAIENFDLSQLVLLNATASGLTGSGANFTFNLIPTSPGRLSVSIPASTLQDAAGDANLASNVLSLTYDPVAPTAALSSNITGTTNVSPIQVTIVFSKAVTGLTLSGFSVVNGTASSLTGSGTNYSLNVSPTSVGAVSIVLNAAPVADPAGNINPSSNSLAWIFDSVSPTVVISSTASSSTHVSPIPVKVNFSSSVTGFTSSKVSVTNATIANFSGSGAAYSFNLLPTSQGAVTVLIAAGAAQDGAGNPSHASNVFSIVYDTVAPTATLASTSSMATNLSPIPVTLTLSEAVVSLSASSLTLVNATVSQLKGSGLKYSFNLVPINQGSVSVTLPVGAVTDLAGNPNTVAAALSRTYDSVSPSVVLSTRSLRLMRSRALSLPLLLVSR